MSGWQLSEKWGWQMSQKGGWQMSQNRGWQMSGWHMYHIRFLDQAPLPGRRQELRELKSSFQFTYLVIFLVVVMV